MSFFTKIEKTIPKLSLEPRKTPNSLNNLNKTRGIIIPDFNTYYKVRADKGARLCVKTDTKLTTGNPETKSISNRQSFDRDGKKTHLRKKIVLNKWCWENSISICKRN